MLAGLLDQRLTLESLYSEQRAKGQGYKKA